MADAKSGQVLFAEPGARWLWVLAGPGAAIATALMQASAGLGFQPLVPGVFLLLVSGFVAVQVKAARIHTSVELTPDYLRQGAETVRLTEITRILPEADGADPPRWRSSRPLGELTSLPRGRTGIGLKLSNDRSAQAWARNHRQLRTALSSAVEAIA